MASNPLTMRAHLGIAAGRLDPVRPNSSPNAIGGGRDAQWSSFFPLVKFLFGSLLCLFGALGVLSFLCQPEQV